MRTRVDGDIVVVDINEKTLLILVLVGNDVLGERQRRGGEVSHIQCELEWLIYSDGKGKERRY